MGATLTALPGHSGVEAAGSTSVGYWFLAFGCMCHGAIESVPAVWRVSYRSDYGMDDLPKGCTLWDWLTLLPFLFLEMVSLPSTWGKHNVLSDIPLSCNAGPSLTLAYNRRNPQKGGASTRRSPHVMAFLILKVMMGCIQMSCLIPFQAR